MNPIDSQTQSKENLRENSIDNNLDNLQRKIDSLSSEENMYSYEVNDNWEYFAKINGEVLSVPLDSPEDLIESLRVVQHMLKVYKESWYTGKLYAQEDFMTRWDRNHFIDIKVDNRIVFDTTFLTHETISKTFWIDDTRDKLESQKIADFLNKVLKVS